jgi:uncharacterized phage protein (TIGR02216 family)
VLALGLGKLKLAPQIFWSLSLPEWRAVTAAFAPATPPLARSDLQTLMQQYPDD